MGQRAYCGQEHPISDQDADAWCESYHRPQLPKEPTVATYKIIRNFFEDDVPSKVIKTGLTLEEAQAHCQDPETSSSTATVSPTGRVYCGRWFDGYEQES